MLKPVLLLSASILIALAILPATGGMSQAPAAPAGTNPVKSTAASRERAKILYTRDCALCHGDNGNGKTDIAASMQVNLNDWTNPKSLADKSDPQLYDAIRKGIGEKMPPEDTGRAKNDEVWELVRYIRDFSRNQPAPAQAAPEQAAPAQPAPEQPAPAPTN
jgi:cytochrome c